MEFTQPLIEMSSKKEKCFWGVELAHKADNLTAICEPIV
jgi:hypothetical protein